MLPDFLDVYKIELLLAFILLLIIALILSLLNQRDRYKRLKEFAKKGIERIKAQETLLQNLEKEVNKIKKSQEGLDYWSTLKDELGELSKLPLLEEQGNEIILRTQLSKLKKDDVDVTATPDEIEVSIYADKTPLKCSYSLPTKINPNKLIVTYKGNTLEIHAQKA